jgi:hypothetical protein
MQAMTIDHHLPPNQALQRLQSVLQAGSLSLGRSTKAWASISSGKVNATMC